MRNGRSERLTNTIRSVTIGSFDGIHIAHQALIAQAEAVAVIERFSGYLTPGHTRARYVDKPLFFYDFERIRDLDAEGFIALLRHHFPCLEKIVVGFDFRFGRDKSGDAKRLGKLFDGEVVVVDEIVHQGTPVHSRVIKSLLQEGEVAFAAKLLGRPHCIEGRVVAGQGIGSKALVPTLNVSSEGYVLPTAGVYATYTEVHGERYASVTFIGHRFTTDGIFAVETHLLDRQLTFTPHLIGIEFICFLRPNRKFATLEALKKQIEADIVSAYDMLEKEGRYRA